MVRPVIGKELERPSVLRSLDQELAVRGGQVLRVKGEEPLVPDRLGDHHPARVEAESTAVEGDAPAARIGLVGPFDQVTQQLEHGSPLLLVREQLLEHATGGLGVVPERQC